MRFMSAQYTIDFIIFIIERYGLTHLTIEDDQFLMDKKRAKEILQGIYELKVKIEVCIGSASVAFIDNEIAELMK